MAMGKSFVQFIICKMGIQCLDQQGISQLFSNCFGHGKLKINFEVLSQRRGYRDFFPDYTEQRKKCLKITQQRIDFNKNSEILFCCYM